jgi:D-methionine transport system ATP-binding protein
MIRLENVEKTYQSPEHGAFQALAPISLEIEEGDIFGIIGYSGAGKSTLLRIINLLEQPTNGKVIVAGRDLTILSPKALRAARHSIGMIFQQFCLFSNRTVAENVEFALEISGIEKKDRQKRVKELLELVGLQDKSSSYPSKLSGGQKQRVAIARALANRPRILLCDEPTSALDPQTTQSVLSLLQEINRTLKVTIVVVTHEMDVVKQICNKVAVLENGRLVEELSLTHAKGAPASNFGRLLFQPKNEWLLAREVASV